MHIYIGGKTHWWERNDADCCIRIDSAITDLAFHTANHRPSLGPTQPNPTSSLLIALVFSSQPLLHWAFSTIKFFWFFFLNLNLKKKRAKLTCIIMKWCIWLLNLFNHFHYAPNFVTVKMGMSFHIETIHRQLIKQRNSFPFWKDH